MALKLMDAGGVLRTISTMRVMDGGTLRRIVRLKVMDEDGATLRTVATFVPPLSVSVASAIFYTPTAVDVTGSPTEFGLTVSATATPSGGLAPFTYAWVLVSGSGWTISGGTSASPSIFGNSSTSTSATVRVTVTDSSGQTATADLAITF